LTCETEGIAEGSGGDVVGWYTNEPDRVLVRLWSGGLHHVPVNALERAAAAWVAPVSPRTLTQAPVRSCDIPERSRKPVGQAKVWPRTRTPFAL